MIEILSVEPGTTPSIIGVCSIKITEWDMIIRDIKVFQKGEQKWIGFASKKKVIDGQDKYVETIEFGTKSKTRFRDAVLKAYDEFVAKNSGMIQKEIIKDDEVLPF